MSIIEQLCVLIANNDGITVDLGYRPEVGRIAWPPIPLHCACCRLLSKDIWPVPPSPSLARKYSASMKGNGGTRRSK
jgi:hypothetical protein